MRRLLPLLLFLFAGALSGCASSQSSTETASSRSAAIGTWKYQVQGRAPLHRGLIQIEERDGRLRALIRDERRGRLAARIEMRGSRLELAIDPLRISGHIENGRFSGYIRRRQWDVSMRSPGRRTRSTGQTASISAERVRDSRVVGDRDALDCRSILRERNGCT